MALRVWLPLNGNLDNQGFSDISFTSTGAPIIQPGKFGNNYYLNGSSYFSTDNTNVGDFPGSFTMSIWFKSEAVSAWTRLCGRSAHKQYQFDINSAGKLRFWTSVDGSDTDGHRTVLYSSERIDDGVWHCACGVCDGVKLYLYIDGVLISSANYVGGYSFPNTKIYIGMIDTANKFKGMVADFRLYDEALSLKQIKELSKGLVTHYKLDGPKGNPNLLKSTNLGTTGWYYNVGARYGKSLESVMWKGVLGAKFGITNGDTSSTSNWMVAEFRTQSFSNVVLKPSTNYVVSFDTDANCIHSCCFRAGNSQHSLGDAAATPYKILADGTYHYTIPITTVASSNTNWTYDDQYLYMQYWLPVNGFGTIANLKLEEGTVETNWIPHVDDAAYIRLGYLSTVERDCSGYGYTAKESGTLEFNSDSPRYEGSIKFDSGYLHKIPSPLHANSDAFTISCWFYPTKSGTQAIINDRKSVGDGLSIFYYSGTQMRFDTGNSYQWVISDDDFDLNKWNFLTFVWDKNKGTKKYYLNGELSSSTTNYGTIANIGDVYSIGNSSTNGAAGAGNQVYGSISDFRIYTTALSAEDVKELYQTSAAVDNLGNAYSREFKEE